jgi:antitoxin component YwqK of YwqJK toxin-antitoxin module
MKIRYYFSIVFLLFSPFWALSQGNTRDDDLVISEYDVFCPVMGGDSIRIYRGIKATGIVKDMHPDGSLKHKGYYDQGRITSSFTNYYPGGRMERSFKAVNDVKGNLLVYYENGNLKSQVEYVKGGTRRWTDYYSSGNKEFEEEFNKGLDYYLYMRFYYESGQPKILFELTDLKQKTYSYREYYENGRVKEEGQKFFNPSLNDYPMAGTWKYYDEQGKLIMEEDYERGQLVSDRKF